MFGFDFPMLHVWNMYRHSHPNWSQCGWIFHREAYGFPMIFPGFWGLGAEFWSFRVFGVQDDLCNTHRSPTRQSQESGIPECWESDGECHTQIEVFGRRIHNPTIFPQNVNQLFYSIFLGFCWFNSHGLGGAKKGAIADISHMFNRKWGVKLSAANAFCLS